MVVFRSIVLHCSGWTVLSQTVPHPLTFRAKKVEAETLLYERSQARLEKVLGPEGPNVARTLHNSGIVQKVSLRSDTETQY